MTKVVLLFLFSLCLSGLRAQTKILHRKDRAIIDSTGKEIHLRGVNLGGWLLWEEWIWGGGFHSESKMIKGLEKLAGKEETEKFRQDIYRNFITEDDIREIAAQQFNVVRIPFNHSIFEPDYASYKGVGWELLDQVLDWCEKYGVYAVLDLHAAPGGQSPYFISNPQKKNLWKVPLYQEQTVDLWKAIAARYQNRSVVAGYDLLNEPVPAGKPEKLQELYGKIIHAIRQVDQQHLVFLEGTKFAKKFDFFATLPDENMAFSFHLYTWFATEAPNIPEKIIPFADLGLRLNVPVWCGEWGENKYEVIRKTFNTFESAPFSGWCMWTWKKVETKYPAVVPIAAPASWTKVIGHLQKPKKNPAPSQAEALQGMREFTEAVQMKNCRPNAEMLRQMKN
ncbi:MAG: glycoside hydrolase family 5 protein [Bacteroidota bacterium]